MQLKKAMWASDNGCRPYVTQQNGQVLRMQEGV